MLSYAPAYLNLGCIVGIVGVICYIIYRAPRRCTGTSMTMAVRRRARVRILAQLIFITAEGTRMNLRSSAGPSVVSFSGTYCISGDENINSDQLCCRLLFLSRKSAQRMSWAAGTRNVTVKRNLSGWNKIAQGHDHVCLNFAGTC